MRSERKYATCSRIAESNQEATDAPPDWAGDWEGNWCKAVET